MINGLIYVAGGNNGTTRSRRPGGLRPGRQHLDVPGTPAGPPARSGGRRGGQQLYVIGGYSGSTYLSSCYAYDQAHRHLGHLQFAARGAGLLRRRRHRRDDLPRGGQIRRFRLRSIRHPRTAVSSSATTRLPTPGRRSSTTAHRTRSSPTGSRRLRRAALQVRRGEHSATSIPGPVPMWVHPTPQPPPAAPMNPASASTTAPSTTCRRRGGATGWLRSAAPLRRRGLCGQHRELPAGTAPGTFASRPRRTGPAGVALSPTCPGGRDGALWYGYCYDTTDNDDLLAHQVGTTGLRPRRCRLAPTPPTTGRCRSTSVPAPPNGEGRHLVAFDHGRRRCWR